MVTLTSDGEPQPIAILLRASTRLLRDPEFEVVSVGASGLRRQPLSCAEVNDGSRGDLVARPAEGGALSDAVVVGVEDRRVFWHGIESCELSWSEGPAKLTPYEGFTEGALVCDERGAERVILAATTGGPSVAHSLYCLELRTRALTRIPTAAVRGGWVHAIEPLPTLSTTSQRCAAIVVGHETGGMELVVVDCCSGACVARVSLDEFYSGAETDLRLLDVGQDSVSLFVLQTERSSDFFPYPRVGAVIDIAR